MLFTLHMRSKGGIACHGRLRKDRRNRHIRQGRGFIMTDPSSPFEKGFRLMGAQQQLAARSLINLIEMISTSSHRYARETTSFTREALELVNEAARTRDAKALHALQQKWTETCLKYGQDQTRATMSFVEQCGLQALNVSAPISGTPTAHDDPPAKAPVTRKPATKKPKTKKED